MRVPSLISWITWITVSPVSLVIHHVITCIRKWRAHRERSAPPTALEFFRNSLQELPPLYRGRSLDSGHEGKTRCEID
ncbi:hypothetical protein F5B17DRAFT_425151, partial [Nemania serpens]